MDSGVLAVQGMQGDELTNRYVGTSGHLFSHHLVATIDFMDSGALAVQGMQGDELTNRYVGTSGHLFGQHFVATIEIFVWFTVRGIAVFRNQVGTNLFQYSALYLPSFLPKLCANDEHLFLSVQMVG